MSEAERSFRGGSRCRSAVDADRGAGVAALRVDGRALSSGGLNARSTGADAASTYFNPARLSRARPGLQLGWFVLNDGIDITLFGRNPANDVPVSALDQFEGRFPPVPTTWLQTVVIQGWVDAA